MLCQNCKKHEATTHIKQVINGEFTEMYLCPECAKKSGYVDSFSGFGLDLGNFFSGFFSQPKYSLEKSNTQRCPKCGSSLREIVNSGKIGCADCYEQFYDLLVPSIRRIHGKTQHSGKMIDTKRSVIKEETVEEKIEKLKVRLKNAVDNQEFEKAARFRDEIRALESEVSTDE